MKIEHQKFDQLNVFEILNNGKKDLDIRRRFNLS